MVLIIGCGNILLGDEGIGVHLIKELKKARLPDTIELLDGGTAGYDLIPYIEAAEKVIIVDSVKGNGKAGEIYRFTPHDYKEESCASLFSLHETSLKDVFITMEHLDIQKEIFIFAVEPEKVEARIGLSKKLQNLLPDLAKLVIEESNVSERNTKR
ncbi:MAG: hydrogenase maturation protease [Candidatus Aureabacteria bacterium]|nr:hydrogenase maturation protease [Candidatus Auribacterota bacterium]